MEENTFRVVLVDDQILCREGIRSLMNHWPEFEIVGEAANGKEAIKVCELQKPDLVLMDVQMPVMNGVEAAELILQKLPNTVIVMLTVEIDDDFVFEAVWAGAKGYILKDTPARRLRNYLRQVMEGGVALSSSVACSVAEEFTRLRRLTVAADDLPNKKDLLYSGHLTEREIQLLRLVADGKSNEEIGEEMYLGAGTVKKLLSAIMRKLCLDNRVQLAVYAVRSGIVS